jgi:beta-glucosidase
MRRSKNLFAVLVLLFSGGSVLSAQMSSAEIERRIDALIARMTVEEKAGQLTQFSGNDPDKLEMVKRGEAGSLLNVLGVESTNAAQHIAVEQTRLKIPLLFGYDVIHGYRTIFPVPLANASSFDPQLIEEANRIAAKEATAAGVKWAFSPMVDIARDPRWGRIVEGAGEDPYLGSVIAAAAVRGFQGKSLADPQSLIACAKHYAAYGAVEGGRDYNTVDISEQLLREVYLPPFRSAVEAGVGTLMSAFVALNGVPATANPFTLTKTLRGEWKFNGFVVSDYNSVQELVKHGIAAEESEASLKALSAGVDMDMADGVYAKYLPSLVRSGKLPMSVLEEAVRRVLRIKFAAGLFDRPYADPARERSDIMDPQYLQVARKLAQESLILLKNQGNLLPLANIRRLAVIGPLANDKANQLGSWAGQGRAEDAVTPLDGIKARFTSGQVLYAKGVDLRPLGPHDIAGATGAAPAPSTATGAIAAGTESGHATVEDAVQTAQRCDAVVMFLGELADMTGEASSRANLDLPGQQQQLLEAIAATGKPVALVLESGRPLDIRWANDHVAAILQAWYPGVQAGNAIADVLFGDVAPSGKLPITWPRSVGQIPIYYNHKNTGRPTAPDRWHTGYLDESLQPLFPFGYGLSYTTFHYSDLRVLTPTVSPTGTLRVSAAVRNDGQRAATEVVQLYVHDRVAATSRPVRELKGFARVGLKPGESTTVGFDVPANNLGSYDPQMNWVVPLGTYDVWIAPNSAEGLAGMFEVTEK